jgi:hypothetical protein
MHEHKWLRWIGLALALLVVVPLSLWAVAALYFDFNVPALRTPLAIGYGLAIAATLLLVRRRGLGLLVAIAGFFLVVTWWLSLRPSQNRNWQPDNAETAYADVQGDQVTIHNFRDCSYRTEEDYTCAWETRTYNLSNLRHVDIFITWWGSPWIAHPIVSFDFGDQGHVAMSIETRDVIGQSYSAVRGFFRQYALTYLASDERDVVRLRTNYRKDEEVYLFRTTLTPAQAQRLFLQYLDRINDLHRQPEWYNAVTNNCTTNIAVSANDARDRTAQWDWRILLNGKGDEMMYEHHKLVTDGLTLPELKQRAHINAAAMAAGDSPDFSKLIRVDRPGFEGQ